MKSNYIIYIFIYIIKKKNFEQQSKINNEAGILKIEIIIIAEHIMAINPFISRIPNSLKKEFEDEITREIVNMKIQLLNKDENGEQEYNILDRYQIFVTYIRKPVC